MKTSCLLLLLVSATLPFGVSPAGAAADPSLRAAGTVSAVAPGLLTVITAGGQAVSFRLVATTRYVEDGQATAQSALAAGESVKVKYHLEANGSLKAKEVTVETASSAASAPVRLRGSLLSVAADRLVIEAAAGGPELTVRLSPQTIYEQGGRSVTAADLRVGQQVKLKYRVEPDRSLKAEKVEIELRQTVSFQLEGTLAGATATTIVVRVAGLRENGAPVRAAAGRTLTLTLSGTTTVLKGGRRKRVAALGHGDRLHVSGVVSGGAFSAARVVVQRAARKG